MVDAFFESTFQVSYSVAVGVVEFIELAKSRSFRALFDGVDVFATPASELVTLIERSAPWDPEDSELGYSYVFPNLDLSLWRPCVPDSPTHGDGQFFEAIGIGILGYFRKARPDPA
jgi:hypothetical protein